MLNRHSGEMFELTCPYCNVEGPFEVKAQTREYRFDHCILECSRCGRQLYARITWEWSRTRPYRRSRPAQVVVYPPVETPPDERIPAQVASFYHEAVRAYNSGCYRACLLLCQRAVDAVCDGRMSPGKALRVRVEALVKRGDIERELFVRLRQVGLLASDPGPSLRSVGAGDAELALHAAEELLYRVYVEKARLVKIGR